ncbi:hypothetical protein FOZ63_011777, partial [Perkinsus olseni]
SDARLSEFYRPVMVALSNQGGFDSFQGFHTDRIRLRPGRPRSAGQRLAVHKKCAPAKIMLGDGWWCPSKVGISDAETCECTDDFAPPSDALDRGGQRKESSGFLEMLSPAMFGGEPFVGDVFSGDYGPGDPVGPQVAGLQDFIEKSEPQLLEKDAMTDDRGR